MPDYAKVRIVPSREGLELFKVEVSTDEGESWKELAFGTCMLRGIVDSLPVAIIELPEIPDLNEFLPTEAPDAT